MSDENVLFQEESKSNQTLSRHVSWTGKALIGLTGSFAIGVSIICIPFVVPAFRKICLPFVPATTTQVNNILIALKTSTRRYGNGKLLDIGSGDGRIVVAAAKEGFEAHGVELNPWLVHYSRISALTKGVSKKTSFFCQDLWKFQLQPYSHVVVFGVEQMMEDLEKKLLRENDEGTQVIACRFPLPNLIASQTVGSGIDQVWIYDIK